MFPSVSSFPIVSIIYLYLLPGLPKTGNHQRKLPLVIHVDPMQVLSLNKTCRYCPFCDLLIAHQDDVERFLASFFTEQKPDVVGNDYYDAQVRAIQAYNQPILDGFRSWLEQSGLAEKTIKNHVDNIDFLPITLCIMNAGKT